jgi:hypothetical protein
MDQAPGDDGDTGGADHDRSHGARQHEPVVVTEEFAQAMRRTRPCLEPSGERRLEGRRGRDRMEPPTEGAGHRQLRRKRRRDGGGLILEDGAHGLVEALGVGRVGDRVDGHLYGR